MEKVEIEKIKKQAEKADKLVCDLASGDVKWNMRIPADAENDSDLILATSIRNNFTLIEALETSQREAEGLRENLDKALEDTAVEVLRRARLTGDQRTGEWIRGAIAATKAKLEALARLKEADPCGHPCPPDAPCQECAGYWDRMREEGLWINGKGWTDKGFKEFLK